MIRTLLSKQRNRRLLLASGMGVIQRMAQLLTTLITLPLVLHSLGLAGFGVWGAATSLISIGGMLDFGIGSALVNFLLQRSLENENGDLRGHVAAAIFGGCALTVLFLIVGLIIIVDGGSHRLSDPFLIAGVALALNIPLAVSNDIWFGLQKGYVSASWGLGNTVLTLFLIALVGLNNGGLNEMVAAVYGAMLFVNAASLIHVLCMHPHLRPKRHFGGTATRRVFTQGGLIFIVTILASSAFSFDNVLALDWLGPDASAQMAIALRVCTTASGLLSVVAAPLWPGFADAVASNDRKWQRRSLIVGTVGIAALATVGSSVIVMAGVPVLRWWLRQDLHINQSLLYAISVWIVCMTLANVAGLLLHATLQFRPQILVLVVAVTGALILKYFGMLEYGTLGIILASPLIWLIFVAPTYFLLAWRSTSLPIKVSTD